MGATIKPKRKSRSFMLKIYVLSLCFALTAIQPFVSSSFADNGKFVEQSVKSVFMLEMYNKSQGNFGSGSGFIAFDSQLLVTNYHVIEDCDYITKIILSHGLSM